MPKYQRVALFLDYENLYTTLKSSTKDARHPYGLSPELDFRQLVDFIRREYGPLAQSDFIAVANAAHYNMQLGGLDRVAKVIAVNSFDARTARKRDQKTGGGKKYVIDNYADMRLAWELGRHVERNPADLYIIGSNDKAFAALGDALKEQGIAVHFMLSVPEKSPAIIKETFSWFDFSRSQTPPEPLPPPPPPQRRAPPPPPPGTVQSVEALCETIGALRRALNTAIPVALVKAFVPLGEGEALLQKAQSQGRIDLWEAPESGVLCVSLREERMHDKPFPIPVRPHVAQRSEELYALTRIPRYHLQEQTRSAWKKAIKERLGLSARQSKALLAVLLDLQLLQSGRMERLHLTMERVLAFLSR